MHSAEEGHQEQWTAQLVALQVHEEGRGMYREGLQRWAKSREAMRVLPPRQVWFGSRLAQMNCRFFTVTDDCWLGRQFDSECKTMVRVFPGSVRIASLDAFRSRVGLDAEVSTPTRQRPPRRHQHQAQ